MSDCTFSTPEVASLDCSVEVTPHTLVPVVESVGGQLPVTGSEAVAWFVVGASLVILGMAFLAVRICWSIVENLRSEDE